MSMRLEEHVSDPRYHPNPRVHVLRCWVEFFTPLLNRTKTFEYRRNDREYKIGEKLLLREWDEGRKSYTGREMGFRIGFIYYLTYDGQDEQGLDAEEKYVVMSLLPDY